MQRVRTLILPLLMLPLLWIGWMLWGTYQHGKSDVNGKQVWNLARAIEATQPAGEHLPDIEKA